MSENIINNSSIINVTFETKCWENDFELMLKHGLLEQKIKRCNYPFTKINLIINNVIDRDQVEFLAKNKKAEGVISEYYFVSDYEEEVLTHFQITKESFSRGYLYSISELVGIYLCKTEYLLHFSSDSIQLRSSNWIDESLRMFQTDKRIKVANLVWNRKYNEARDEAFEQTDAFYIGYGFSDQCYLINTSDFNESIYSESNSASARYPAYADELFEKRVDAWMRNNRYLRATFKSETYIHRNIPCNRLNQHFYKFRV